MRRQSPRAWWRAAPVMLVRPVQRTSSGGRGREGATVVGLRDAVCVVLVAPSFSLMSIVEPLDAARSNGWPKAAVCTLAFGRVVAGRGKGDDDNFKSGRGSGDDGSGSQLV